MVKTLFCLGLAALAVLAGCGGPPPGTQSLTAAGATFPYPMYSKWFSEYRKLHPEVEINYQSIGSGGGIKQVTEGTVDFGATDGPMNDAQLKEFTEKRGGHILHFPTVLGADVPSYNIPRITAELNFTPAALAGIFLGTIKKWNDPELVQANPGVVLPAKDVVVVHRSDGSGTTYCWVDYLSKVSPEWKTRVGVGTSVNWPVGLGGKGNEGLSGLIKQTPFSIGYVELIFAVQNKMPYGKVRNAAGSFVKAGLDTVTAAADGAAANMPADFRMSIANAAGENAYPISTFTWLLIPDRIPEPEKRAAVVGFLSWMIADGQRFAGPLSYAPLPASVVTAERPAIAKVH